MTLVHVLVDLSSHPCLGCFVLSLHLLRPRVSNLLVIDLILTFLDQRDPEVLHTPLWALLQRPTQTWMVVFPFSPGPSPHALTDFLIWTIQSALGKWALGYSACARGTQIPASAGCHFVLLGSGWESVAGLVWQKTALVCWSLEITTMGYEQGCFWLVEDDREQEHGAHVCWISLPH